MTQKVTRLNQTLQVLGYQVSVEDEKVYLFGKGKYVGNMSEEDFHIWALHLTAERAVTEYILLETKKKRLSIVSDEDIYRDMAADMSS